MLKALLKTSGEGRTARAAEHLRLAERAMKRARAEALKIDLAPDDGLRLTAWGAVFVAIDDASDLVNALKLLVVEEMQELLERGSGLSAEDKRELSAGVRAIQKQIRRR
ncbi:MAG: hypothetical protein ABIQ65_12260 [Thermoanaerobaculia bacterium]